MIGFLSKLFSNNKKAAVREAPQKMPETQSGLNEEMVSKSVDIEPREDGGLAEVFDAAGKEEAKEEAQEKETTETASEKEIQ